MARCDTCRVREAVSYERIRVFVSSLGVSPTVLPLSSSCAVCTEEAFLGHLSSIPLGLLVRVGESVSVSWERYVHLRRHAYRDDGDTYDRANAVLLMLGVFTRERNDNWEIRSAGDVSLNPESVVGTLYFTSCVYAFAFAREALCDTAHSWFIFRYGDVMTREEILAKQRPALV